MNEMRVCDGVKESSKNKINCLGVHGLVMWKTGNEKLAKKAGAQKGEGKWRRERPKTATGE